MKSGVDCYWLWPCVLKAVVKVVTPCVLQLGCHWGPTPCSPACWAVSGAARSPPCSNACSSTSRPGGSVLLRASWTFWPSSAATATPMSIFLCPYMTAVFWFVWCTCLKVKYTPGSTCWYSLIFNEKICSSHELIDLDQNKCMEQVELMLCKKKKGLCVLVEVLLVLCASREEDQSCFNLYRCFCHRLFNCVSPASAATMSKTVTHRFLLSWKWRTLAHCQESATP